MKKNLFLSCLNLVRTTVFFLSFLLVIGNAKAQTLANWPLRAKSVPAPTTPLGAISIAPGITAGISSGNTMIFTGKSTFGSPNPANQGLKLKQSNTWLSVPNPNDKAYSLDFPLSPAAGKDLIITGLTFDNSTPTSSSGSKLAIAPYYQIDSTGNWISLAPPQSFNLTVTTTVSLGSLNVPFFSNSQNGTGHTYVVRLYVYSPDGATKSDYFYLANVIFSGTVQTATAVPTVTTSTPVNVGKYGGIGIGTYDYGSTFQKPTIAGVTWSMSVNPSIVNSFYTTDGVNGKINAANAVNITSLTAGTTYHVRGFIITPIDTLYGQDFSFTTDPTAPPIDSTTGAINVRSNRAIVGGVIIDSGDFL